MVSPVPDLAALSQAIADLDDASALALVRDSLAAGVPALDLLKACQDGMAEVGARFEQGDYFVAELVISGEIFRQAGALLQPALTSGAGVHSVGKVVLGSVKGDIHDLGKNMVALMLRAAAFEVIDLGVDVPPARFVESLRESGATVLGLSCLLTYAFASMRETVAAVAEAGLRERVKIMIGGGPVDARVCEMVGADGWGGNANVAVRLARQWLTPAEA